VPRLSLVLASGLIALGLVVGFVLGGVAPRRDADRLRRRADDLQEQLDAAERSGALGWRSPVPGFDRILRGPERAETLAPDPDPPAAADSTRERPPPVGDAGVPATRGPGWRDRWRGRGEERVRLFERAASAQRVRRVQSRAALFRQAELAPEEMAEVDAIFDAMNGALQGYGEEIVVLALGDAPPSPEELLTITHDVTGILAEAQGRLGTILGDRSGGVEPSALEVWNHIDLSRLEPAARQALEGAP
jgi:hypothetical protein